MEAWRRVVGGWGKRREATQTPPGPPTGGAAQSRVPRRRQSPKSHGARGPQGSGGDGGVTQAGSVDSGRSPPSRRPRHPYLGPPAARGRRAAAAAAGPGATGRRAPWAAGGQGAGRGSGTPGGAGSKLRPSLRSQRWAPAARFNYPAQEEGAGRARRGRGRGAPASPPPGRGGDLRAPSPLGGPPSWHHPSKEAQAHGRAWARLQTALDWGAWERGARSRWEAPHPPTHTRTPCGETRSPPHPRLMAGWVSKVSSARLHRGAGEGNPASGEGSRCRRRPFAGNKGGPFGEPHAGLGPQCPQVCWFPPSLLRAGRRRSVVDLRCARRLHLALPSGDRPSG